MILEKIKKILEAEIITGARDLQMEIMMGCGCDMMSDVLAFIKSNSLLLTGLTNPQVIRTAEMADIKAVCFIRGKKPGKDTVELAKSKNIPLLLTDLPMFEACGRLYKEGLPGCSEVNE
jgi:predicted transcriptional regulator